MNEAGNNERDFFAVDAGGAQSAVPAIQCAAGHVSSGSINGLAAASTTTFAEAIERPAARRKASGAATRVSNRAVVARSRADALSTASGNAPALPQANVQKRNNSANGGQRRPDAPVPAAIVAASASGGGIKSEPSVPGAGLSVPSARLIDTSNSTREDLHEKIASRLCMEDGCTKRIRSKGLCKAHGGGRRCTVTDCDRSAQSHGMCIRHGGGTRCTHDGCTKSAQSNGLCKAHGGGPRCQHEGCTKATQGGGYCRNHGGGQRCGHANCTKGAQRGGYCASHGGTRYCQFDDCTKQDRGGGFCAEHGGGSRCKHEGCTRPARRQGLCYPHSTGREPKPDAESSLAITLHLSQHKQTPPAQLPAAKLVASVAPAAPLTVKVQQDRNVGANPPTES